VFKVRDKKKEITNSIFNVVRQVYIHTSSTNRTWILYSFTILSERYNALDESTPSSYTTWRYSMFKIFFLVTIPHKYQAFIQTLNQTIFHEIKGNIKVVNLTRINNQATKLNNYHLIIPIWPKKFIYQKQNSWIKTHKKQLFMH
jgi:hypothetical protein